MENVIDLKSRKPLAEKEFEEAAEEIRLVEEDDERILKDRAECIALLDAARVLVEEGRLTGLIVIGMDPVTDYFFNEMRLTGPHVGRSELFSYIGILDALKIEMMEPAMMAPVLRTDGKILDPYLEAQSMIDDFDDYGDD